MIGTGEIIVILLVVLVLFGGKKLPEFARSLGKGIREFKRAVAGESEEVMEEIVIKNEKRPHDESRDS